MRPRGEQGHPIAEHFSRPDHDKDDFRVQVILSVFSSLGFYHTKIMPVLPAASTAKPCLLCQVVEVSGSKLSWDRLASKERWMRKLGAKDAGKETTQFLG